MLFRRSELKTFPEAFESRDKSPPVSAGAKWVGLTWQSGNIGESRNRRNCQSFQTYMFFIGAKKINLFLMFFFLTNKKQNNRSEFRELYYLLIVIVSRHSGICCEADFAVKMTVTLYIVNFWITVQSSLMYTQFLQHTMGLSTPDWHLMCMCVCVLQHYNSNSCHSLKSMYYVNVMSLPPGTVVLSKCVYV